MDSFALSVYVNEVGRQAAFADHGMRILREELAGRTPGSSLVAFAGAQAILTAGAQISKLMWADTSTSWDGNRVKYAKDRASELRTLLSPDQILQQRAVRNAVEHFDERLDLALQSSGNIIIDANIAVKDQISAPGAVWLRNLDPQTYVYSALDKEIDLLHLHASIQAVGTRANVWMDTDHGS